MYSSLNRIILDKIEKKKLIENYKKILIAMNPVIPHFSNECLELFYQKEEIKWPKINEEILVENNKNFVVQINGKTRGIIEAKKDITEEDLLIKINQNSKLKNYVESKSIRKKIFIPEKLINIIVS
jgi:leucyl-tRNA synthetase